MRSSFCAGALSETLVPEGDRVRAFLALPRDRMWVESARALMERLQSTLPKASWTKPESWHLTLKFLGDVPRSALETFGERIAVACAEAVAGEILADGPVVFPPRGEARVLGVGFSPNEALDSLARVAQAADGAAEALGVAPEKREFRPHVTLARLRDRWPEEAVASFRETAAAWAFPPWQARSCVLYESRLDPAGAVHTPLAEWSFTGGARGVRA
jgi:RNA 2',3'-cyclic 3'-phosphodiesterase